jgi:hypothetical protein
MMQMAKLSGHRDRCTRVHFDFDKIVSASFDTTIRIWNFSV